MKTTLNKDERKRLRASAGTASQTTFSGETLTLFDYELRMHETKFAEKNAKRAARRDAENERRRRKRRLDKEERDGLARAPWLESWK